MANFNFNKVILGGRLTADSELKTTPSGISVTSRQARSVWLDRFNQKLGRSAGNDTVCNRNYCRRGFLCGRESGRRIAAAVAVWCGTCAERDACRYIRRGAVCADGAGCAAAIRGAAGWNRLLF